MCNHYWPNSTRGLNEIRDGLHLGSHNFLCERGIANPHVLLNTIVIPYVLNWSVQVVFDSLSMQSLHNRLDCQYLVYISLLSDRHIGGHLVRLRHLSTL